MMNGVVPYINVQIGMIWGITITSGIVFGTFGLADASLATSTFSGPGYMQYRYQ